MIMIMMITIIAVSIKSSPGIQAAFSLSPSLISSLCYAMQRYPSPSARLSGLCFESDRVESLPSPRTDNPLLFAHVLLAMRPSLLIYSRIIAGAVAVAERAEERSVARLSVRSTLLMRLHSSGVGWWVGGEDKERGKAREVETRFSNIRSDESMQRRRRRKHAHTRWRADRQTDLPIQSPYMSIGSLNSLISVLKSTPQILHLRVPTECFRSLDFF